MSWIRTAVGHKVNLLDPHPRDICLTDIAQALSRCIRFNGHCRGEYTNAQHSVLVARLLPPRLQAAGLLHDAAEAYTGDILKPVKDLAGVLYKRIEDDILRIIFTKYRVPWPSAESIQAVKCADRTIMATECRDILGINPNDEPWECLQGYPPCVDTIPRVWEMEHARDIFVQEFQRLIDATATIDKSVW